MKAKSASTCSLLLFFLPFLWPALLVFLVFDFGLDGEPQRAVVLDVSSSTERGGAGL